LAHKFTSKTAGILRFFTVNQPFAPNAVYVIKEQTLQQHGNWLAAFARAACLLLLALLMPSVATAQTFSNTTGGAISNATPCTTPLIRTFTSTATGVVTDVNIGALITHAYRGDIRLTLQSPTGTRVQLVNGGNVSGDNYNVLLDDAATTTVNTTGNTTAHSTTAPPYQNTFRPNNALSAFNSETAAGTWQLEICDTFPSSDNGNFVRADLTLTAVTSYADLSMTKTVSNTTPAPGASISYTLQVTNSSASPTSATGVTVNDVLPAGVTFVSSSGFGSYNSGTGVWTVGSIPPGTTRSLTINVTVSAASNTTVTNTTEVRASSVVDPDSTPNDGSTNQDDDAQVSFTVTRVAGTPPVINCPIGSTTFDWGANSWTPGSLNNTYTLAGVGNFNIAMSSTTPYVSGSPAITNQLTGGVSGEVSLFQNLNNNSISDIATTVLTMPGGLPGVQFTLFDIDFGSGSYADKIVVTGSYQGSPVIPVLTNNTANEVTGNTAIGDVSASDTSAAGNVVVTFNAPIDTVTVVYGNHTTAPADPGNQWIGWGDIRFCNPYTTSVNVSKISWVVSDGVSGANPKALPGATVRYCITVANTGGSTMGSVVANDSVPTNLTFIAGSIRSGTTCGGAANVEDDGNSGADETDPFGGYFIGTTVTGTAATLSGSSAFVFTFDATVN
jgi:uncharacterized repeat protein (TIGR01451 family)